MYIIHTFQTKIYADAEDYAKLMSDTSPGLVVLKKGVVNPKHVTTIELNYEEIDELPRVEGETLQDRIERARTEIRYEQQIENQHVKSQELPGGPKHQLQ